MPLGAIPFGGIVNPQVLSKLPFTPPVIDYVIGDKAPVSNPDGSAKATLRGLSFVSASVAAKVAAGQDLDHALRFGPQGSMTVPSTPTSRAMQQFAVELVIRPGAPSRAKVKLVEAQSTPFAFALERDGTAWRLRGSVHVKHRPKDADKTAWISVQAGKPLAANRWHRVTMIWDGDDIFLLINGAVAARRAVRNASLAKLAKINKNHFWVGTWVDGRRDRFVGDIAALRIWNTVPTDHIAAITKAEADGFGAIASRYEDTKSWLGAPVKNERADRGGRIREYQKGAILWRKDLGALVVRNPIWPMYKNKRCRDSLGFPIAEQMSKNGVKMMQFEKGAIYWSQSTGTGAVWGPTFLRYLTLTKVLGLPLNMPYGSKAEPDRRMNFQRGKMYFHEDVGAFEVHGLILERYEQLGQDGGVLGLPVSDEEDVRNADGVPIGKVSRFQNGAIFFRGGIGAHEVHGEILKLYDRMGGPSSKLGFPTTGLRRVSGSSAHYVAFEHGLLVCEGGEARLLDTLQLRIGEIYQAGAIDDGYDDSGGEFYTRVTVHVDGKPLPNGNNKRFPSKGHKGGSVPIKANYTFPVRADTKLYMRIKIWDHDQASANDYHGCIERTFTVDDLWCTKGREVAVLNNQPLTSIVRDNTPRHDRIQTDFVISGPSQPVDPNLFRKQAWWSFRNFKTPNLSKSQYSRTFRDVDYLDNWWEAVFNPFDALFYELAFKGAASGGNCFGFSSESLHALQNTSVFPEHIYRIKKHQVEDRINIMQASQYGAETIGWALKNLVNLDMIHGRRVYAAAKREIDRCGACVISTMDLTRGAGHAVLAYRYEDHNLRGSGSSKHGRLYVADPNRPWHKNDEDNPHPSWIDVKNNDTWKTNYGFESKTINLLDLIDLPGAVMFHVPYRVVAPKPRTPFWEILLALFALLAVGGLIILAGDGSAQQVSVNGKGLFRRRNGKRVVSRNNIPGMRLISAFDSGPGAATTIASDRRIEGELELDVRGTRNGRFQTMGLFGPSALHIDNPISRNASDKIVITDGSTSFPVANLETSQRSKSGTLDYGILLDPTGRPARKFRLDLPQAKGDVARVSVDPRGGALVVSASGPARKIDVEVSVREGGQIRTGFLRGLETTTGAEALRIKAGDWTNPQGNFEIERLSSMGGGILASHKLKGRAR